MTQRELFEQNEIERLSPYAAKSALSCGRAEPMPECDMRTAFQRDRDRITHSKAFRRLMHKTQVFIAPEGDHYRTRLTHTLEVAQIARAISRSLNLNEDLTEAIALGHDLGHAPFGHTGEDALDKLTPGGFAHNEQSVRIVKFIENGGKGLNLTYEVIDGIANHRTGGNPATLEGHVVRISDKIAYINHDIEDALRAGALMQSDLPADILNQIGETSSKRIDYLIRSVINESRGEDRVGMESGAAAALNELREFMFRTVYESQLLMRERVKIRHMFEKIYYYFLENPNEMPGDFLLALDMGETLPRVVSDHIACMTDRYALRLYQNLFVPGSWV